MHIHWGKALDAFKNQHRSSLNMRILTQFLIFEAVFQASAFKCGTAEALKKLSSGFYDYSKILFLAIIWRVF